MFHKLTFTHIIDMLFLMLGSLFFNSLAGGLGLYLSSKFVAGFAIADARTLIFAGLALGIINTILKPAINIISLPLRFLTFGLASVAINMIFVEIIDIVFPGIQIAGLVPLFWSTIIISLTHIATGLIFKI